jgi:hypothetical protein
VMLLPRTGPAVVGRPLAPDPLVDRLATVELPG